MRLNDLKFATLRAANAERVSLFTNRKGEIIHKTAADGWSLAQWSNAMCGEAGEVANLVKKIEREDFTLEEVRGWLADELADVIIYADLLAQRAEIDLGQAVVDKFNIVSEQKGIPVFIKKMENDNESS